MAKDLATPTQLKAMTSLLWSGAIDAARSKTRRKRVA